MNLFKPDMDVAEAREVLSQLDLKADRLSARELGRFALAFLRNPSDDRGLFIGEFLHLRAELILVKTSEDLAVLAWVQLAVNTSGYSAGQGVVKRIKVYFDRNDVLTFEDAIASLLAYKAAANYFGKEKGYEHPCKRTDINAFVHSKAEEFTAAERLQLTNLLKEISRRDFAPAITALDVVDARRREEAKQIVDGFIRQPPSGTTLRDAAEVGAALADDFEIGDRGEIAANKLVDYLWRLPADLPSSLEQAVQLADAFRGAASYRLETRIPSALREGLFYFHEQNIDGPASQAPQIKRILAGLEAIHWTLWSAARRERRPPTPDPSLGDPIVVAPGHPAPHTDGNRKPLAP